jgi:hypothetical protein
VWLGVSASNFVVVVLGRTLYGLGAESVFVGVEILVTKWFTGYELGFAYGLVQAAGQAGSFCALYTIPALVDSFSGEIGHIYLISTVLSGSALVSLLVARVLEQTALPPRPEPGSVVDISAGGAGVEVVANPLAAAAAGAAEEGAAATGDKKEAPELADSRSDDSTGSDASSTTAGDGAGSRASVGGESGKLVGGADGSAHGAAGGADGEHHVSNDEPVHFSAELVAKLEDALAWARCVPPLHWVLTQLGFGHLFLLPWQFWCVMAGIVCYSASFYTFLAFGVAWLTTSHGMDDNAAGETAGIISIFSMVVSPSTGLIMDIYGYQHTVCFLAMVSSCFWFATMGFTEAPPVMTLVFAAISYSLLPSSLYPLLPEYVPEESFATVRRRRAMLLRAV